MSITRLRYPLQVDPMADVAEALLEALADEPVPQTIRDLADQLQAALNAKKASPPAP